MRRTFNISWIPVIVLLVGVAVAQEETPSDFAQDALTESQACVDRLRNILDTVTQLEEDAVNAKQQIRASCIHARTLKIKGLVELTEAARSRLAKTLEDEVHEAAESELTTVQAACMRAEKLLAEAGDCGAGAPKRGNKQRESKPEKTSFGNLEIVDPQRQLSARKPPERTDKTCLKQATLARLMVKAMELSLEDAADASQCIAELQKLAVAPLDGWDTENCATVDDVMVVAARAMKLQVSDPGNPASYCQSLRDEGLGVDTLLPSRFTTGEGPYVLETEVRAFLASGYAAPLPSAQRIAPD